MFLIGIVMPGMAILSARKGLAGIIITPKIKKTVYWTNSLFLWIGLIIVLAVWLLSNRSLQDLGLKNPIEEAPKLWLILFYAFLVLYLVDTFLHIISPSRREATIQRWKKYTPFMPTTWEELLWFLLVALSAGICEELIYRGYMINYLLSALKHQNTAVVFSVMIPAVIFAVAHSYQGKQAVLKIVVMAMLFGYIFILTQSLILLIVVHVLIDVLGGFLGLMLNPEGHLPETHDQSSEEE